jgi:hypothetical protein
MARLSLTIEDLSDREFLLVVRDLAGDDGWTDSDAIRERLDLTRRQIASTRLSWLAREWRYGSSNRRNGRVT